MWIGFGKKRNLEFLLEKFFVNIHLEARRRVDDDDNNDDDDDDDDDDNNNNNNNMVPLTVDWEDCEWKKLACDSFKLLALILALLSFLRYALFWNFTQRRMIIYCRRFGTTHWSHLQRSSRS